MALWSLKGRSPYEPTPEAAESPLQPTSPRQQQYNARGEPIDPLTTRHNEAMIAAKNEVLAAVGVCEKKDKLIDNLEEELINDNQRVRFTDQEWKIIKEGEDDYGELIRMIAETSRNVLTWWIMSLRKRVQVGLISSDLSFIEILIRERANLTSNGILGAIRYLTVGGFSEVVSQLMLTFADWYLGEYVLELSKKVIRLKASTRKRFMLLRCVNYGYKTLNALVHLSIYSLSSFSCLQQLGLISSTSFLPPKSWLLPWSPSSPLHWAFLDSKSNGGSRMKSLLLSPAALWLTMSLLQHSAASAYGHVPLFEYSCILGPHNAVSLPQASDADDTNLLTPFSRLRNWILQSLGWAPVPAIQEKGVQDLMSDGEYGRERETRQRQTATRYRVTELSTLPSNLLALNLDYLIWAILMLPLDTVHLRTLASLFLSSPTARIGIQDGLSAGLVPRSAATRTGMVNTIGLCLALEFTLDTAVWGGAFLWAKYIGTSRYHWGHT
ncbi:hypothetical protein D6C78_02272 [Aureobasidium pullulans]|uniref:Uncharacterized protein n=1 Tax=Aureobasidium pullulans TaxID=5580 RepID=A0A4T0C0G4_AURPU|nr:hypothetical protein D6C78_02272 [Aureobasidium pullulans]